MQNKKLDSSFPDKKKSVAFIGSVGIPNCYGGFESFLESVTPVMVQNGNSIIVTCDKSRYEERSPEFLGVSRLFINISANGATSPIHDLIAYLKVFRKTDSVVVLGVSAGPFFLIMRVLTSLFGKKLVVNVDGVEWRRSKFSKPVQYVLKIFDFFAQFSATRLVYDNKELLPYIYKPFRGKAVCIAYSGDHVLRIPDVESKPYALTICRIEPENNLELLIEGALQSKIEIYNVIGNWDNSEYGRRIKEKYKNHSSIKIIDPIYDQVKLAKYREQCSVYLHGHSVGGTNPSLVEMLFYDCNVLCFDCGFNRATAGNSAEYFSNAEILSEKIVAVLDNPKKEIDSTARSKYTAEFISKEYLDIL